MRKEDNELLTQVGPGTPMGALFRRYWMPALLPSQLPGPDCPQVRLRLLGENLIAFRDTAGEIGVFPEGCPHRGASLYYGRNEEHGLRCVYHGWKFNVEGRCVEMPTEPFASSFQKRVRLRKYPAREWGGFIWVYMGPEDQVPELPEMDWAVAPASHRYQLKWEYEANYLQGMEGEIDSSHTTFLHRYFDISLLTEALKLSHKFWQLDETPDIQVRTTDYGMVYGARRKQDEEANYWRVIQWMAPMFALIPSPSGMISCRAYVPIDDHRTMILATRYHPERPLTDAERLEFTTRFGPELIPGTFLPVTNKANDYMLDREAQRTKSFTGIPGVNNQDRAIVESMGSIVDRTKEHLGKADIAIGTARRILMRMAREADEGIFPDVLMKGATYRVRPLDISDPAATIDEMLVRFKDALSVPAVTAREAEATQTAR